MNLLFKDVHGGFYIKIYFLREIDGFYFVVGGFIMP